MKACEVPARFAEALQSMQCPRVRSQVRLEEVPGPRRVAPYSVALEAEVLDGETELATGRLVVLHDPDGQEAWQGDFRVVALIRTSLEQGWDDALAEHVAWGWLTEAVERAQVGVVALGGTVTRILSSSFGALAAKPDAADLELRASWTPIGLNLGAHVGVWSELLAAAAGLPPLPEGVTPLGSRPRRLVLA